VLQLLYEFGDDELSVISISES